MSVSRARRALALAACIVAAGCAASRPLEPESPVVGVWEWVRSVGGIAGQTVTPAERGVNVRYAFQPEGTLLVLRSDGETERVGYRVTSPPGPGVGGRIRFTRPVGPLPPPQAEQLLRLEHADTLVLGDLCADCFEHVFARVR